MQRRLCYVLESCCNFSFLGLQASHDISGDELANKIHSSMLETIYHVVNSEASPGVPERHLKIRHSSGGASVVERF